MERILKYEPVTEEDLTVITRQLGRRPRGVKGIVSRCPEGCPRVILNRGIIKKKGKMDLEILPTLFWLTCPALHRIVSRFEDRGGVKKIQEMINADPDLKQKMEDAHRSYARLRWNLLTNEEKKILRETNPALQKVMRESGIGGIRGEGIKCLHTHLADYLAGGDNPAGAWIAGQIDEEKIQEDCFFCKNPGFEKKQKTRHE